MFKRWDLFVSLKEEAGWWEWRLGEGHVNELREREGRIADVISLSKRKWLILYTNNNTDQFSILMHKQRWKLSSLLPDAGVGVDLMAGICETWTLIISVFSAEWEVSYLNKTDNWISKWNRIEFPEKDHTYIDS